MKVILDRSDFGLGYSLTPVSPSLAGKLANEIGEPCIVIDSDWDFPSLARSLGWRNKTRKHDCYLVSDGTINCSVCGRTNSQMIQSASEFLDKRLGRVFNNLDDYFPEF